MKLKYVMVLPVLLLAGCVTSDEILLPDHMAELQHKKNDTAQASVIGQDSEIDLKTAVESISTLKGTEVSAAAKSSELHLAPGQKVIAAENMPLIQFVHLALRDVLGVAYEASADVVKRRDTVNMSVNTPVNSETMLGMIEETLALYGVAIVKGGKVLKVVSTTSLSKEVPIVLSDKIKASIALGRVMEFIPLHYVETTEVGQLSQFMLGSKKGDQLIMFPRFHAVLVVGDPSRINRLREAIALIDRPAFLGKKLLHVRPAYWEVGALVGAVKKALNAEGIPVSKNMRDMRGVRLIPISENNSLIVSTSEASWLKRTRYWLEYFDKPNAHGAAVGHFQYFVKHAKAGDIGGIAKQVMAAKSRLSNQRKRLKMGGLAAPVVIVNDKQNSIVFVGKGSDYKAFLDLMHDLDRPRKSVLIEVTVAEVTLNSDLKFGVEWQLRNVGGNKIGNGNAYTDTLGTLGGLGVGGGGLTYTLLTAGNAVRASLNALASSGRVKLLSNPTLLALNGESSRLQVGTQLPIVSQEVAAAGATVTNGVVRTFTMVDTGVILELTPEVHEGDVVQIKLHQEVSEAGQSATNTPPILKRSVDTTMLAKSGQTILIGGLISHNDSTAESKVPLLGDIPLLGKLFSSSTITDRVTELIVLVTPHIIHESDDMTYYTEAFKRELVADKVLKK